MEILKVQNRDIHKGFRKQFREEMFSEQINQHKPKSEATPMQENEPTIEEVVSHIEENSIDIDPAQPTHRDCVDGRAGEEELSKNKMAVPGGDLGLILSLMKLGYSAQDAFDKVNSYLKRIGSIFTWHSDKHVEHELKHHIEGNFVGCGHCNAAIKWAEKYGVDANAVKNLLTIIRAEQEISDELVKSGQPATMSYTEYPDDHEEIGVIIMDDSTHSVAHKGKNIDGKKGKQFFVFDRARYYEYLKDFVVFANENNDGKSQIEFAQVKEAIDEQTTATLGLLKSSIGKPMYLATYSAEGKLIVEKVGNTPDFTPKAA